MVLTQFRIQICPSTTLGTNGKKIWQKHKGELLGNNHQFANDTPGRNPTITLSRNQADRSCTTSEYCGITSAVQHCTKGSEWSAVNGTLWLTFHAACVQLDPLRMTTKPTGSLMRLHPFGWALNSAKYLPTSSAIVFLQIHCYFRIIGREIRHKTSCTRDMKEPCLNSPCT